MKKNVITSKKRQQKKIETIKQWVLMEYPNAIDRDYNSVIIRDFEIEFLENLVTITKDGRTRTHGINTEGVYLNIINMFPELDMVFEAKEEAVERFKVLREGDVINSDIIVPVADNEDENWYAYSIRRRIDDKIVPGPNGIGVTKNPFARWKDHFLRTRHPEGRHGCGYFHGLQDELYMYVEENLGQMSYKKAMEFEASYKEMHNILGGEFANRKFTMDQAQEIRDRYNEGASVRELVEDFGASSTVIRNILAGYTYRY